MGQCEEEQRSNSGVVARGVAIVGTDVALAHAGLAHRSSMRSVSSTSPKNRGSRGASTGSSRQTTVAPGANDAARAGADHRCRRNAKR